MKSVNEVTACNCEQIMVSVQPNGDCTAKKVSNEGTKVSITAIKAVLSDYVGKKTVGELAKAIAEVVDASSNADKAEVVLIWKDGTKYQISDDGSGKPKIVELKEETSNLKDEIRGIVKDDIAEKYIDEFLERVTTETTTVKPEETEETEETKETKETKAMPAYMPEGFKYLDGAIESKDYRIVDKQGNVFTWVPERTLKNGKTVAGFFLSTYEISKDAYGVPRSVEGELPWVSISWTEAREQASKFDGRLISNDQWDSICEECAETIGEIKVYENSAEIGNYLSYKLRKTGEYLVCGCSNLAGNCWTWTNEIKDTQIGQLAVIRGGSYYHAGYDKPMAGRSHQELAGDCNIGFRIVI